MFLLKNCSRYGVSTIRGLNHIQSRSFLEGFLPSITKMPSIFVTHKLNQALETRKTTLKWKNPIVNSAHSAQRALYHIYIKSGLSDKVEPIELYPVYQIACFFAWYELMRVNCTFLDHGSEHLNRRVNDAFGEILTTFTSAYLPTPVKPTANGQNSVMRLYPCRLSLGQVKYMSESLIVSPKDPTEYLDVVAPFSYFETIPKERLDLWIKPILEMTSLTKDGKSIELRDRFRLVLLQHKILHLIDALDPSFEHIPEEKRSKIVFFYEEK
eukprot:c23369_g1_i1.p1 GENE.c23369_g1_i1~~c23369_g1_i1.p1  ORF type:complete len:269 (-),score=90.04 c23369_g1_i1:28-834(-)